MDFLGTLGLGANCPLDVPRAPKIRQSKKDSRSVAEPMGQMNRRLIV